MEQSTQVSADDGLARRPPKRRLQPRAVLRSVVLPLAVLALIVGGLVYWDSRGGGTTKDDARFGTVDLPPERNPTGEQPKGEVGRPAPDFVLQRPEGGTLRLSDLQGRPVLVNFWAHWCPPCRAEIPELVKAYSQHRAEGLIIIGVNLQESNKTVLDFASDWGMTFPIVIDREGELTQVWRLGGPIKGIPSSYFVDKAGVIRAIFFGPMTERSLAERLAKILPEGTS